MKFNDTIISLVLMAVAIAMFVNARSLPSLPGQPVGPALFPMTVSVLLGSIGAVLFARSFASGHRQSWVTMEHGLSPANALGVALVPASVIAYVAIADDIGFIGTSFIILFTMMVVYGVRMTTAATISAMVSAVSFLLFRTVLVVPLPESGLERGLMEAVHAF